jgi:hypothetical protein
MARMISRVLTLSNATVVVLLLNNARPRVAIPLRVQIAVDLLSRTTQSEQNVGFEVLTAVVMKQSCFPPEDGGGMFLRNVG